MIETISALDWFAFCALLDYQEKYQKVQIINAERENAIEIIETAIILQLCRIALIVISRDSLPETCDK